MKKIILSGLIVLFIAACGNSSDEQGQTPSAIAAKEKASKTDQNTTSDSAAAYDPNRGEGKFTKVDVSPTLDNAMAENKNETPDTGTAGAQEGKKNRF